MTCSQLVQPIARGEFTFVQLLLSTLDILLYIPTSATIQLLFLRLTLSFDVSVTKGNVWLLLEILKLGYLFDNLFWSRASLYSLWEEQLIPNQGCVWEFNASRNIVKAIVCVN